MLHVICCWMMTMMMMMLDDDDDGGGSIKQRSKSPSMLHFCRFTSQAILTQQESTCLLK